MIARGTGRRRATGLLLTLLFAAPAAAQQPPRADHEPRAMVVAARAAAAPVIDGTLTDEAWAVATPVSGFTQLDPDEGLPATERTEIRMLYDDVSLYVAARMFDSEPDRVARRLSRRDESPDADRISVYLDTMHDHKTGFMFQVSASGVQRDQVLFNDSWTDQTWDGVWDSAVSNDGEGWCAEMRIPLSQLRFAGGDRQTWGVNVERYIQRKNETAWLELVPKNENGLASRMAHFTGIDGVQPKRHLELLPYTAARTEFIAPDDEDNPFNDGSRTLASAGLDLKYGVTSNLTLNAAVNPDFGQVEVDPAVVNLSAFETFFEEKRPFFLEGSQLFGNFGQGGSNSFWGFNTSDPQIFYSRRIGRAPQLSGSGDFVSAPAATTILAATKLTGKTSSGWSIGFLDAVTDRETARVVDDGVSSRADVEPFTNYAVVRLRRDIGRRGGAGLLMTTVNRRLDSSKLREGLASRAYVAGGEAYYFFDDRLDWVTTGKFSVSHVSGTPTVIEKAQKASARYLQRPDAPHVTFDPARTSLTGFAGRINLNKNSGLRTINAAFWGVSPGFESNDLGFHGTGDRAGAHVVFFTRNVTPGNTVRSRSWWIAKAWTWNFNRELQSDTIASNAFVTFVNYWTLGGGGNFNRRVLDDRLTRGGPSATLPANVFWNVNFGTDSRRALSANGFANGNNSESGAWRRTLGLTLNLKPSPMLTVSTGPQYSSSYTVAQYIDQFEDATAMEVYGGRYVFGEIDQKQLTLTTRVNVIFSPRHSLQVFTQPLIASGRYSNFKELARPRSYDFLEYADEGRSLSYNAADDEFTADPDGIGPAPALTFDNPDFSLKSLRLSAVFRWELKPGSALFAVWTRQQEDEAYPGTFALGRDTKALLTAAGDDVFLVKIAYWIGR
jgi:hypothetical protein